MSKAEILEELPKLAPEDRYEIRLKLAELDGDDWLDDDDPRTDQHKNCSMLAWQTWRKIPKRRFRATKRGNGSRRVLPNVATHLIIGYIWKVMTEERPGKVSMCGQPSASRRFD
jgi:hypothetical protein